MKDGRTFFFCRSRKVSGPSLDSPYSAKNKLLPNEKIGSESESISSGNKSGDNSPTASPFSGKRYDAAGAGAALHGEIITDLVFTTSCYTVG